MAPKRGIAESNVSTPSWPERSVADPHDPTNIFLVLLYGCWVVFLWNTVAIII